MLFTRLLSISWAPLIRFTPPYRLSAQCGERTPSQHPIITCLAQCKPVYRHFGYDVHAAYALSMTFFSTDPVERRRQRVAFQSVLRDLRQERGLNQQQMAKLLGVPQQWVSRYETGERRLDVLELLHILETLGVPLSEFIALLRERLPPRV